MRSYAIKGIDHIVYDDLTEVPSSIYFLDNWRDADLGDWVFTDDNCVIQILRRGKMLNQGRYKM